MTCIGNLLHVGAQFIAPFLFDMAEGRNELRPYDDAAFTAS